MNPTILQTTNLTPNEYSMKICILTSRFPFPQFGGDALRINEIARYLKRKGHTLILVSMSDSQSPDMYQAMSLYDNVYYAKRSRAGSLFNCLIGLFCSTPLQCSYYRSGKYMSLLKTVLEKHKPDLYISHLLRMVPYLEKIGVQQNSIVEMTDALSKAYGLSSCVKGVGFLKYIYMFERNRIQRYEQYVIDKFPKVVCVSQNDIALLEKQAGKPCKSLAFHTNGVTIAERKNVMIDCNKICFLGNMRSILNQDAALFFVNDIFPLIKQHVPDAKFYIVGSLPPANIQAAAAEDVIVTGFVNDLEGTINDSCVCVAPNRVAAGIQNKVLVAMGCAVPVVMTPLISGAIPQLKDGENCLIASGPQSFADSCVALLCNMSLRNRIGSAGYDVVSENYDWDTNLEGYELID